MVEWTSKGVRTPNELRTWLEEMMRKDGNLQKEYWELFFEFEMAASQMDPNDKKSSILDMEVKPVTTIDPKFCKWADQLLDATLVTRPPISLDTNRGGTAQMDYLLWENYTKVMGSGIRAMIQKQQSQYQPDTTPSE